MRVSFARIERHPTRRATGRQAGRSSSSSSSQNVQRTDLEHELGDDAVELGASVVELLAADAARALLARAKGTEVLGSLGHGLAVEAKQDPALGLAVNLDIEVHFRCDSVSNDNCKHQHERHKYCEESHFLL